MPRQLINIEGVDRSFGPVDVLLDINLLVQDGDRIGIVGHNGAGKTTLLNTISEQTQDVGDIDFAPGIRLAYLTQIRDIDPESTIEQELGRKGRQFQELEDEIAKIRKEIETSLNKPSKDIFFISAATGEGTIELLKSLETEVIGNKEDLA